MRIDGCFFLFGVVNFLKSPLLIRINPRPLAGEGRVRGRFLGFLLASRRRSFRKWIFRGPLKTIFTPSKFGGCFGLVIVSRP